MTEADRFDYEGLKKIEEDKKNAKIKEDELNRKIGLHQDNPELARQQDNIEEIDSLFNSLEEKSKRPGDVFGRLIALMKVRGLSKIVDNRNNSYVNDLVNDKSVDLDLLKEIAVEKNIGLITQDTRRDVINKLIQIVPEKELKILINQKLGNIKTRGDIKTDTSTKIQNIAQGATNEANIVQKGPKNISERLPVKKKLNL